MEPRVSCPTHTIRADFIAWALHHLLELGCEFGSLGTNPWAPTDLLRVGHGNGAPSTVGGSGAARNLPIRVSLRLCQRGGRCGGPFPERVTENRVVRKNLL